MILGQCFSLSEPQFTYFSFKVYLFILRERERERVHAPMRAHVGGRDREGRRERESQAGSAVSAEPDVGLDVMNAEITT